MAWGGCSSLADPARIWCPHWHEDSSFRRGVSVRMPLTSPNLSPDERFSEWGSAIERLRQEHVSLGWSQYVFRLLREIFNSNEQLRRTGGFLMDCFADWYVTHALMVLRRDMDKRSGTENVVTLLYDMKDHAEILTLERFLASWETKDPRALEYAEERFESWAPLTKRERPEDTHVSPDRVQRDIDELGDAVESVRRYAEMTKAHRTPETDPRPQLTYGDMHAAIDQVRKVLNRYYSLLTNSSMAFWEPVPQYSVFECLKHPWLADDPEVIRAVAEAIDRSSPDDD